MVPQVVPRLFRNGNSDKAIELSRGLVVKGGDSYSEGCEFESKRRILDGYFSHLFVWKDENKRKKAGFGPFYKKAIEKWTIV